MMARKVPRLRSRVNRDVKAVHGDVHALLDAGVPNKIDDGLVVFPFDAIHIDAMLHAAK
jgi:predicted transcriptional regulator